MPTQQISRIYSRLDGLIKGRKKPLPTADSHEELANKFGDFYITKLTQFELTKMTVASTHLQSHSVHTSKGSDLYLLKSFY